jgi:hypothetical protein
MLTIGSRYNPENSPFNDSKANTDSRIYLVAAWTLNYENVGRLTIGSHYKPASSPFNDSKAKYIFINRSVAV